MLTGLKSSERSLEGSVWLVWAVSAMCFVGRVSSRSVGMG